MPVYTPNYNWTLPDPGGSPNVWGNILNTTMNAVDAQVFANQLAGVPIGTIMMWGGTTAPVPGQGLNGSWLMCDGTSYSTTGTYAALFAVCGIAFNQSGDTAGTFRVPNLAQRFPLGGGQGIQGGAATVTLDQTMLPVHTHTATQAPHNHNATDGGHQHYIEISNQIPHQHNYQDWGTPEPSSYAWGYGSAIAQQANASTATTAPALVNLNIVADNGPFAGQANFTNAAASPYGANYISIDAQQPAVTVANAGGTGGVTQPTPIMPPYVQINFIIRFA